jgi:hypothetical protein
MGSIHRTKEKLVLNTPQRVHLGPRDKPILKVMNTKLTFFRITRTEQQPTCMFTLVE